MVEYAHIDQLQGVTSPSRDHEIGLTGFSNTGRVIVSEDDRSGIEVKRTPDNFARMDCNAVNCAMQQLLTLEQAVPHVQVEADEGFIL